ncbi:UNVERIFIED_ORG: hypothetical protein J2Y81_007170 [Paraburkholderia sediminicola]|jgi:hypothetical protein|nr:hypothetical protein [Paraburkholderia sediminicola]
MSLPIDASYRGYSINVQVTSARTLSFHGVGRRYMASWIVTGPGYPGKRIASVPERLEFMSEHEAFRYAENRAHTFIDCVLSGQQGMPPAADVAHGRERSLDRRG